MTFRSKREGLKHHRRHQQADKCAGKALPAHGDGTIASRQRSSKTWVTPLGERFLCGFGLDVACAVIAVVDRPTARRSRDRSTGASDRSVRSAEGDARAN